jgi:hypothetical protein
MSQPPRQPVRPGFLFALLIVFGLVFIIPYLLPTLGGSGKAKLPQIIGNLRQIYLAKELWASDHAATNGAAVSEPDLVQYLRPRPGSTGLVASVDGEVYRPNAIGTPPEAKIERAFGSRFPKGTIIRWATNAGCEILVPNPQGRANGWQPLSSLANRTPEPAAPRRSP